MRVVIAEDSVLLRRGAVRVLEEAGIEVAGESGDAEELLRQVRELRPDVVVADGGSVLDPEVVAHMLGPAGGGGPLDALNDREREVLGMMAEGRTNRAISQLLFMSERAVERHVTAIFSKLDLPTPTRLTAGCSRRSPIFAPHSRCGLRVVGQRDRCGGHPAGHGGASHPRGS